MFQMLISHSYCVARGNVHVSQSESEKQRAKEYIHEDMFVESWKSQAEKGQILKLRTSLLRT